MGFHGGIGAAIIYGGDIQGATIEGGTITGAKIQTAADGFRVEISDTAASGTYAGIAFFGADGQPIGYISADDTGAGVLQIIGGSDTINTPKILINNNTQVITLQAEVVTGILLADNLPSKMISITGTYTAGPGGIVTIPHTFGSTGYDAPAIGLAYALRLGARTGTSVQYVAYPFGSSVPVGSGTSVSLSGTLIGF